MSVVLVFILGASALAFFGCFFLGLCRDGQHADERTIVEVVQLSKQGRTAETNTREPA